MKLVDIKLIEERDDEEESEHEQIVPIELSRFLHGLSIARKSKAYKDMMATPRMVDASNTGYSNDGDIDLMLDQSDLFLYKLHTNSSELKHHNERNSIPSDHSKVGAIYWNVYPRFVRPGEDTTLFNNIKYSFGNYLAYDTRVIDKRLKYPLAAHNSITHKCFFQLVMMLQKKILRQYMKSLLPT